MTVNRKLTGRASSMAGGLAIGAIASILVTVLICAIGAHMISREILAQSQTGYCAIAALLTATITGGAVASGKIKRKKMMVCLLSGLVYFSILIIVTALLFGGRYQGIGVTLITVAIGSIASALLVNHDKKKKVGPRRKKIR